MFENPEKLLIILMIALLIFGPSKLAGFGGTLGRLIRDFRTHVREAQDTFAEGLRETQQSATSLVESYTTPETSSPQALPGPDPGTSSFPAPPAAPSAEGSPDAAGARADNGAGEFEGPYSLASEPSAASVREIAERQT